MTSRNNTVQLSPYLKHLHLPVHAFVNPHLVNSQQLSAIDLASFTVVTSLDLSYISTTNFSKACRSLSLTAEGHSLSVANVSETSSHTSHAFQADFFDSHIFLHAQQAVKQGHKSLIIDANDTDIVIVVTSVMPSLVQLGLDSFGKGRQDGPQRWFQP